MVDFDENLLGCFSELPVCCFSLCPGSCCVIQAIAVDRAQGRGKILPYLQSCCLFCIGASINRGLIRDRYSIDGSFLKDCLIWIFCVPCAATQEFREVNRREGRY